MILTGRAVTFEIETPTKDGSNVETKDGYFLAFGIKAATDEGSYSRPTSSYSCALVEDDFGFVHAVDISKVQFKNPLG